MSPTGPKQSTYDATERSAMYPFIPSDAQSFLDIGCARGGFGRLLRRRRTGVRIVGVDPVEETAADAKKSGYDEVHIGYFPEALPRAEKFDCIVMNDVLEHMLDPWSVLGEVRNWVAPNGSVVASIPSIQYLPVWLKVLRGRWEYADYGTLDRTHLRFFTRRSMIDLFDRAGFKVEQIAGINSMGTITEHRLKPAIQATERLVGDARFLQFAVVGRPV